jgi:hypothetical protein
MGGVGLGMAGLVGVPAMGKIADRYLAEALPPAETVALLQRAESTLPSYLAQAQSATDVSSLGYQAEDVQLAIDGTATALAEYRTSNSVASDATANALRAIIGASIPGETLAEEANAILAPADRIGGQASFRDVAPFALILVLVFGAMYINDRRKGGYRAVRLERH